MIVLLTLVEKQYFGYCFYRYQVCKLIFQLFILKFSWEKISLKKIKNLAKVNIKIAV